MIVLFKIYESTISKTSKFFKSQEIRSTVTTMTGKFNKITEMKIEEKVWKNNHKILTFNFMEKFGLSVEKFNHYKSD